MKHIVAQAVIPLSRPSATSADTCLRWNCQNTLYPSRSATLWFCISWRLRLAAGCGSSPAESGSPPCSSYLKSKSGASGRSMSLRPSSMQKEAALTRLLWAWTKCLSLHAEVMCLPVSILPLALCAVETLPPPFILQRLTEKAPPPLYTKKVEFWRWGQSR